MRFTNRLLALILAAIAPVGALAAQGTLPVIAPVHGDFAIRVQYPKAGTVLDVADSTFLFGTVGDGRATLTINAVPIPVAPNGAWLAWVAVPHDSLPQFRLEARRGNTRLRADLRVVRAGWTREQGAWLRSASMYPTGMVWRPESDTLELRVTAVRGAGVRLLLPDGSVLPFRPDTPPVAGSMAAPSTGTWYRASWVPTRESATLSWVADSAGSDLPGATLEVVREGDTTRTPWPITLHSTASTPLRVRLSDDPSAGGGTDRLVNGRTRPGGTYHWFFPNGTTAVADAREGEFIRLRLGRDLVAWVARKEVHPVGASSGASPVVMGSLALRTTAQGVLLRVPLAEAVPHAVTATPEGLTISLFNTIADADWTTFPAASSFLSWLGWRQVASDRVELAIRFDRPLYGWRVRAESDGLVFEFRTPPEVRNRDPLAGRRIVLDAGHPPAGACGPTGLCEAEATLAVARLAEDLLRASGAHVTLTRTDALPVSLSSRIARADSVDADALVSIHLNAFPDGVNPFTRSGTTTFFQHPQARDLALAVQQAMVVRFGIQDLGVGRGDLALVRPTWYPAILTEGLFLMIPAQEAAMRHLEGQMAYAEAIVAGLRTYFGELAVSNSPPATRLPVVSPTPSGEQE